MSDEDDGAFVDFLLEVGSGIDAHTSRMRDSVLGMLSQHLRAQRLAMQAASRAEITRLEQSAATSQAESSALRAVADRRLSTLRRHCVALCAASLARLCAQRLRDWAEWRRRRRGQRSAVKAIAAGCATRRAFHTFAQWRLFAAARRQQRIASAELTHWRCREAELSAEAQALREMLEAGRRHSDALEERLRTAFVRGVCALNREAAQVLRGAEGAETTAESATGPAVLYPQLQPQQQSLGHAITAQRHAALPPQQQQQQQQQQQPEARAPCEEHYAVQGAGHATHSYLPPPGPPCHVCYAPRTCPYSPVRADRATGHQPFVVSVDPAAVRSYGVTPATRPSQQSSRPAAASRVERLRR